MEPQHSDSTLIQDDDAKFYDAVDEFSDSDQSISISELNNTNNSTISAQSTHSPEIPQSPSSAALRRRSLVEFPGSNSFKTNPYFVDFDPHVSTISPGKNYKVYWDLNDTGNLNDKLNRTRVCVSSGNIGKRLNKDSNPNTTITSANGDERINDENTTAESRVSGSSLIFTFAGLVLRALGFQVTILLSFVMFPLWFMYSSYMFMINPLAFIRRLKRYILGRISEFFGFCYGSVKRIVHLWVKKNESKWRLFMRMGLALLWSAYIGFVLIGLLVLALVVSGVLMRLILERPLQMTESLNFDYTKDSPIAFVPIMACPESSNLDFSGKIEIGGDERLRFVPLDHKLQVTLSLTLPESDYNRNLGVFQVRVDFLSGNGKTIATTTQPSMLRFKSQPIRLLLTFFNLVPLLAGFSSESQTLDIKFNAHTETEVPTSCLRVVMEQRAEFTRGSGIPEIYTASIYLESQLSLLKRILWSWKVTMYVWTSMAIFTTELMFVLLCCTPVIVPRLRSRGVHSNNNESRGTRRGQK